MDTDKVKYELQHDLPTPEPDSPVLPRARKPYRFSTLCATVENPNPGHKDQYGASSVPIYQTATFKGMGGEYDYTRSGNPTRTHLGKQLLFRIYLRQRMDVLQAARLSCPSR